jgi:hypothetical protein
VLLIIEIALGIVLGAFLLWVIVAIANYEPSRSEPRQEPTVWLICIGGLTECFVNKDEGKEICCRDMLYDPAFANTVHQFARYEDAKAWAKEMVNVSLSDNSREAPTTTFWHGNLEVREVTPSAAAAWLQHRGADGKLDPVYLAECEANYIRGTGRQAAEEAAHMARMRERQARGNN